MHLHTVPIFKCYSILFSCSDVITAISSARQVAIRAKFARFNSVRANGKTAEIREEAADIINFLSSTCKLSSCEIKCVFKHFGGF